jgi:hypothetical protein
MAHVDVSDASPPAPPAPPAPPVCPAPPGPPVAEERRTAPDGILYSRAEFIQYFGGLDEWEAAVAVTANASPTIHPDSAAVPAAAPRLCVGNLSRGRAGSGPAPQGFTDVRVDRQTALGNPFPMGEDGHDEAFRDAVCEACDELLAAPTSADVDSIAARHGLRVDGRFRRRGADDPQAALAAALEALEARVRAGESLRLLCWCHPKRCHADGIAATLQRRVGQAGVVVVTHSAVASRAGAVAGGRVAGGRVAGGGGGGVGVGGVGVGGATTGGGGGGGCDVASPAAASSARRGSGGGRSGRARGGVSRLQGRGLPRA